MLFTFVAVGFECVVFQVYIPVKYHGFAVSLTVLAMKTRSHADYVISHAFQL